MKLKLVIPFLFLVIGLFAQNSNPEKNKATGYVYVKQIDGVWWFIGPDGEKFVSLGVNHIEPHLWLAPYNIDSTLKKYGADMVDQNGAFNTQGKAAQKWIEHVKVLCDDLGFNTFAKHIHPSIDYNLYKDKAYYLVGFETAPVAFWRFEAGDGPLPDVFSTEFEMFVNSKVAEVVNQHKNDRNLLGYMYTDIPCWILPEYAKKQENERVMIYPWVNAMFKQGDYTAGKQKWIEHLKSRYPSTKEVAKVWNIPYDNLYSLTWEDLARRVNWLKPADLVRANDDMVTFLALIAERWYVLHYNAIRKLDTNHLIWGDKNMIEEYDDFLINPLKKYVDVIVYQSYNLWKDDKPIVDRVYKQTGKPLINGDGSYAFIHPRQQRLKVKGWWTGAKDIKQVAQMYKETMEGMMKTPYVIGWHHCGMLQQWDEGARGDVLSNENGFLDPWENYYTEWTDVIKDVNKNMHHLHEQSGSIKK